MGAGGKVWAVEGAAGGQQGGQQGGLGLPCGSSWVSNRPVVTNAEPDRELVVPL